MEPRTWAECKPNCRACRSVHGSKESHFSGVYQSKRPTATQRPSRNGWGYILLQPYNRILSCPLKCCYVSVVTGGGSRWHHWVKKSKLGNRKSPWVEWHINVYPSIYIERSIKTCTVKCQSVQRICFWSMEYFAFFFLHFCIYIFYTSMHRECKYYLCKQNKWMNTQMRKKQNCIKVQQGTNFPGKGKSFSRRLWTSGGRGGGQHGAGDQWPVCVAAALLLVLTWNTLPRKASGISSNPTTVGFRDLPRPLPAQKLKLLSDHKWNQSRPNIRLEAGWPWPWPWVVVSYLPRLCWAG